MKHVLQVLVHHPYIALFVAGLLERTGAPLLLSPVLIAAGALAATQQMRLDMAVWITLVACIAGDTLWFEMGRSRGESVLSILCRISFEPDSCVRKSKVLFGKGTDRTLLLSKWIPGISHVVPAIAGLAGIRRERFFVANTVGSFFWIIAMMLLGYLPVQRMGMAQIIPAVAPTALEAIAGLLVANVAWKYYQKERFVRELDKVRMSPQELKQLLDAGKDVVILDLRHALDSVTDPRVIPGAIRLLPDEVTRQAASLPKDAEIILYCT